MTIAVKLVFNKLPALSAQMRQRASAVVRKTALDIEAGAKGNLYAGHGVDTGNLKNSIQATGPGGGEIAAGDMSADVGTVVDYAAYVEYGTRKMAAIPYLTPAAEAARPGFDAAMKRIADSA